MRAVLGLLLILGGVVTGYLVLTGKLPNGNTPFTAQAQPPAGGVHGKGPGPNGGNSNPTPNPTPPGGGIGGAHPTGSGGPFPAQGSNLNPMGLPTMQYLQDIGASQGGYQ